MVDGFTAVCLVLGGVVTTLLSILAYSAAKRHRRTVALDRYRRNALGMTAALVGMTALTVQFRRFLQGAIGQAVAAAVPPPTTPIPLSGVRTRQRGARPRRRPRATATSNDCVAAPRAPAPPTPPAPVFAAAAPPPTVLVSAASPPHWEQILAQLIEETSQQMIAAPAPAPVAPHPAAHPQDQALVCCLQAPPPQQQATVPQAPVCCLQAPPPPQQQATVPCCLQQPAAGAVCCEPPSLAPPAVAGDKPPVRVLPRPKPRPKRAAVAASASPTCFVDLGCSNNNPSTPPPLEQFVDVVNVPCQAI